MNLKDIIDRSTYSKGMIGLVKNLEHSKRNIQGSFMSTQTNRFQSTYDLIVGSHLRLLNKAALGDSLLHNLDSAISKQLEKQKNILAGNVGLFKISEQHYQNDPNWLLRVVPGAIDSSILNKLPRYFDEIDRINSSVNDKINHSLKTEIYEDSLVINQYGIFGLEDSKSEATTARVKEASRIQEIIQEVYRNNEILYSLEPREFEKLVAELLGFLGFEVSLTKATRDGGYDILAIKPSISGFAPIKYLVECKRFKNTRKVGVSIVREFRDVIRSENANKGIIVTSSYFSQGIQEQTPWLLEYKDRDDVINWVSDYQKQTSTTQYSSI